MPIQNRILYNANLFYTLIDIEIVFHMKKFIPLFLLLFAVEVQAQSRDITLMIDTIILKDAIDKDLPNYSYSAITSNKKKNSYYSSEENIFLNNNEVYFAFVQKINIENDSISILIPVDANGSYIQIENPSFIDSGFIRINKIVFCKNMSLDSTEISYLYYKIKRGKISENPYKVKSYYTVAFKSCSQDVKTIIINGISYELEFHVDIENETMVIEHMSGYKFNRILKRENDKRKISYFKSTRVFPRIARILLIQ
jgi:RNA recognition motif-containing protein